MAINISKYIGELLYHHDSVIIPELGGIIASYNSASIDHVQGLLHPPSKSLSFNKNLRINDGILINYIQEEEEISLAEANEAMKLFVEETNRALEKREIVVFPKVGRLYKDYENKLQFLQDSTNFNTDVYGLPTIQFYPILRSQELSEDSVSFNASRDRDTARKPKAAKRLFAYALPSLIVLSLIALAVSTYFIKVGENGSNPFAQALKVNTKPVPTEAITSEYHYEEADTPVDAAVNEDGEYKTDLDTESITTAPDQKEAVIIIGAFRKKAGVRKSIEEIYALGYAPYQDKKSNLTRVGVQLAYDDPKELETALKIIRNKIVRGAWILKQ